MLRHLTLLLDDQNQDVTIDGFDIKDTLNQDFILRLDENSTTRNELEKIEILTLKDLTIETHAFSGLEFPSLKELTFDNVKINAYAFSGILSSKIVGALMPNLEKINIRNNLEIDEIGAFGVRESETGSAINSVFWRWCENRELAPDLGSPNVFISPNTTVKWGKRVIPESTERCSCSSGQVGAIFRPFISIADGWNTKQFIGGLSISWASEWYIYYSCWNLSGDAVHVSRFYSTKNMSDVKLLCDGKTKEIEADTHEVEEAGGKIIRIQRLEDLYVGPDAKII